MTPEDDLPLKCIADFPADFLPDWTLRKLLDRVRMVAQFDCGRYTFAEAMLEAFGRIEISATIWAGWDEEMRAYATRCNQLASAAHAAVMKHLEQRRTARAAIPLV